MDILANYLSIESLKRLLSFCPELVSIEDKDVETFVNSLKSYNLRPSTISTCLYGNAILNNLAYDIDDMLEVISNYSNDLDNILEEYPEILGYDAGDLEDRINSSDTTDIEEIIGQFITEN